jgi:tRNA pseudouridine55 synthase
VKVDGVRAYKRVRAGEDVVLPARRVTVSAFELTDRRGDDLDVRVSCSTGTYVRALARDLGDALGVGGHLTALRRTRVGPFTVTDAYTLDALAGDLAIVPLAVAVAATFPRYDVDAGTARRIGQGQRLAPLGLGSGPTGVFGPDGSVVALVEERDDAVRPVVVFVGG